MKLALVGPDLGDVDMEVADRIAFEGMPGWLVAGDLGQAADAVALQTAVKRRSGQVRQRSLERLEAAVQWQQAMLGKEDDRLFLRRSNRDRTALGPIGAPCTKARLRHSGRSCD